MSEIWWHAKYPIRRVVSKSFTIPQGSFDFTHENIFNGQNPTRVIIGCVDNDAYNGTYKKNPFNFKNYDIKNIRLYLDGQEQNIRPINTNFDNNQYILGYHSLFSGTNKLFADEGIDINREEYPSGYTLFAFDLTADLGADDGQFSLIKTGSLRCSIKFGTATPNTINVICLAEFETIIQIDKNRNIIYDHAA